MQYAKIHHPIQMVQLVNFLLSAIANDGISNCPSQCRCTVWFIDELTVICINQNLTHVPPDIPLNVVALYLDENPLSEVKQKDLSKFKKLNILSLTRTEVGASLSSDVFQGLEYLEYLSLSNSNISQLEPGFFFHMTKLLQLDLSWNRIETLHLGTFVGLQKLQRLFLSNNFLQTIEADVFAPLQQLVQLRIEENPIIYLLPSEKTATVRVGFVWDYISTP